jgi:hypothetical protein
MTADWLRPPRQDPALASSVIVKSTLVQIYLASMAGIAALFKSTLSDYCCLVQKYTTEKGC